MKHALAVRTHFSLGESLLKPEQIIEQAKAHGYQSVAITDTMSINAMVDFSAKAKEAGIKPIIGCRLRVVDHPHQKKVEKGEVELPQNAWYPKVYVLNDHGMRDLIELLSIGYGEECFYYVPRIGLDHLLVAVRKGNLAVSTGDFYSVFHHPNSHTMIEGLHRLKIDANARVFVEVCPINTPLWDTLNTHAIEAAREFELPLLLTRPMLYEQDSDADTLDVLTAITSNTKMAAPWRSIPFVRDFSIRPFGDLLREAASARTRLDKRNGEGWCGSAMKEAVAGLEALSALTNYEWKKLDVSLPQMAENELHELADAIKRGFKERLLKPVLGYQPAAADLITYQERLKYELSVLKKMGFERYFLLVQDLVGWSKRNGIMVGPGRGSVGGSLIAFLLGITDVDPIRFGLIFERFINPERIDLPDADLDFMSSRRHEVIDYLNRKYGSDRVAGISNYSTLASASALRDTGRVHEVSDRELACTKYVPKEHGQSLALDLAAEQVPELAAFKENYVDLWSHATRLEGTLRNLGQHAAGIVVAGEPLINRAVVSTRGEPVVNWDKRVVEDWGLVKMDILGLSTLDVLKVAADYVRERHKIDIDYTAVPLDDSEVMGAFGKGETVGVFQFESSGMRKLLKDLARCEPLTFDDLSAATSLYRPGPMDSGLLDDFVSIKQGFKEPYYEHPNMEPALCETQGVIIYQEQIMRLATDLAGFTFAEADHLRKAMGKKDKVKMAKMREQWVNGCGAHSGMGERQAGELFDKVEAFAGYGFNKSHAVEYSIISYWTMWLKVRYPAEFYAAALTVMKEEKLEGLVGDAQSRGVYVAPPDINLSTQRFEIGFDSKREQTLLITPLNRLKGLSDNTTAAVLEARAERPFKSKEDFLDRVNKRKVNKRHQEVLDRVGAFAAIEPEQIDARHPDRLKDQKELMPGLIVELIRPDRGIVKDPHIKGELVKLINEVRECKNCTLAGSVHPLPQFGKSAKIMVVTDCPNWSEEQGGRMFQGDAAAFVRNAMKAVGLNANDAYFTSMVKAPKSDKQLTTEQINGCAGYLRREVELLKPPVIVALGSGSIRHFVPGVKGGFADLCGKVEYLADLDASVIFGINPMMIYHDPSKQDMLDDVFRKVAELVL